MRKLIGILFLTICTYAGFAQPGRVVDLYSSYGTTVLRDTVTNTGTGYLTSPRVTGSEGVVIQCVVTKLSGTVAGTIQLQASLDGTNFKAITTPESNSESGLADATATNANNSYVWRLTGVPFPYYRISWTGTGTMSAWFTAKLKAQ